jgi:hypothetical protein
MEYIFQVTVTMVIVQQWIFENIEDKEEQLP